jgi:hypothetical protein
MGGLDLQKNSRWTARHVFSAHMFCAENEGEN